MSEILSARKTFSNLFEWEKALSFTGVFTYWLLLHHYQSLKLEHILVGGMALALYWSGTKFQKWRTLFLPLLLTAMVYDSQRLYSDLLRGPIHVTEPYQFDRCHVPRIQTPFIPTKLDPSFVELFV